MKIFNVSNDEFYTFLTEICDRNFVSLCDDLYGDWSIAWLQSSCYDGSLGRNCGMVDLNVHYQKHDGKTYVGFTQHRTQKKFFCVYDAEKQMIKIRRADTNVYVEKALKKIKRVLEVKF